MAEHPECTPFSNLGPEGICMYLFRVKLSQVGGVLVRV